MIVEFTEEQLEANGRLLAVELPKRPDAAAIAARVCRIVGYDLETLRGRSRTATVARARKALYRALRASGMSYPEIGAFCHRDHSTVIAGCRLGPR